MPAICASVIGHHQESGIGSNQKEKEKRASFDGLFMSNWKWYHVRVGRIQMNGMHCPRPYLPPTCYSIWKVKFDTNDDSLPFSSAPILAKIAPPKSKIMHVVCCSPTAWLLLGLQLTSFSIGTHSYQQYKVANFFLNGEVAKIQDKTIISLKNNGSTSVIWQQLYKSKFYVYLDIGSIHVGIITY